MTRILIIAATFYRDLADELVLGAKEYLDAHETEYDVVDVPGAFEIPGAIRFALESGKYDGYVALGCVIRGETSHYDYVCSESARGLMDLAVRKKACVGNGILTVENKEQAWKRAGVDKGNKGAAAAEACLAMVELKKKFGKKKKK